MKIFNVIDTDKVARDLEQLGRKVGLSISTEESEEILRSVWLQVEKYMPDRYKTTATDSVILFDMEKVVGSKQYGRYKMARKQYLNHILYSYQSRGCMAEFIRIFPPYVVFPEQIPTISHGDYNQVYEYYLLGLSKDQVLEHFKEFPIPEGHGITFVPEKVIAMMQTS